MLSRNSNSLPTYIAGKFFYLKRNVYFAIVDVRKVQTNLYFTHIYLRHQQWRKFDIQCFMSNKMTAN
jgi:hypothetical protein